MKCSIEELYEMLSARPWPPRTKENILLILSKKIEAVVEMEKEHGPFIVWASQMKRAGGDDELWQTEKKLDDLTFERDVRLGAARRARTS